MITILYGISTAYFYDHSLGGSVSFSDMEEYDPELREFYEDSDDDEDW